VAVVTGPAPRHHFACLAKAEGTGAAYVKVTEERRNRTVAEMRLELERLGLPAPEDIPAAVRW